MIYKVGMLCKHFKGTNLYEKNIYRIEKIGVNGKDIDESIITYTGDGNLIDANNLIIYSNIFQNNKLFCREFEDISSEISDEKKSMFNQNIRVQPLNNEEIAIVNSEEFINKKLQNINNVKIELNDFIIESDKEISYLSSIISTLENDTKSILEFFELEKLSHKKRVVIFTDREKYKEHLLPYVSIYREWMCADTYDGNINLLEISEARKSKEHEDMTIEDFIKDILHEFVHACQQEWNTDSEENSWYWEALATNLSNQDYEVVDLSDCNFEKLKEDFNSVSRGYSYAYTLGKFMLENYTKEKLLEFVKNPDLLRKEADSIFNSVKESQIKKSHK